MKHSPPAALVDLLTTLGLATPWQVRTARGRVRRLGGSPQFESLWVDALAQCRVLTPWQAAEINADRGAALKVGPFILCEPLASLGDATVFRARRIENRAFVRLTIADRTVDLDEAEQRLKTLAERADSLRVGPLVPVVEHGREGDLLWAVSGCFAGRSAQRVLIERGRFPPLAVSEIARQMLVGLVACELAGMTHGDLGAGQVWLDRRGRVWLPEPGLYGALHPSASNGDSRSELNACGALWWHLLTGLAPFAGAAPLDTLRATLSPAKKLPDIRHLAPDTPPRLADVVAACLARDPSERPESLAFVAALLGEPSRPGQRQLARLLRPAANRTRPFTFGGRQRYPRPSTWGAAAAGAVLALAIIAWPTVWQPTGSGDRSLVESRQQMAAAKPAPPSEALTAAKQTERAALSPRDQTASRPPNQIRPSAGVASPAPIVQAAWQQPEAPAAAGAVPGELPDTATGGRAGDGTLTSRTAVSETVTSDGRRKVMVSPDGLEVTQDEITFENVDFVADRPLAANAAMLILRGSKTVIRGCSFQTSDDVASSDLPAAIRLNDGVDPVASNADLSTGTLEIENSVFRRVKAAVSCPVAGGTIFRLDNVLYLGSGPAFEFDRFPEADEVLSLSLSRVTLRGARSLIEVGCHRLPAFPGRLEVDATDCAFVLPAAAALVEYHGATRPGPLLKGIRWSGQGSVLSPRSRLALWRTPEGRMLAAADEVVPIEGVVRAEVGFAGGAEDGPSASRIVRWQAPLRSPRPPGVNGSVLHLPEPGSAVSD